MEQPSPPRRCRKSLRFVAERSRNWLPWPLSYALAQCFRQERLALPREPRRQDRLCWCEWFVFPLRTSYSLLTDLESNGEACREGKMQSNWNFQLLKSRNRAPFEQVIHRPRRTSDWESPLSRPTLFRCIPQEQEHPHNPILAIW